MVAKTRANIKNSENSEQPPEQTPVPPIDLERRNLVVQAVQKKILAAALPVLPGRVAELQRRAQRSNRLSLFVRNLKQETTHVDYATEVLLGLSVLDDPADEPYLHRHLKERDIEFGHTVKHPNQIYHAMAKALVESELMAANAVVAREVFDFYNADYDYRLESTRLFLASLVPLSAIVNLPETIELQGPALEEATG
jgi:hypothetical protein